MDKIFRAIEKGNIPRLRQLLKRLLRKGSDKQGLYTPNGFSLQTFAVSCEQKEAIETLATAGYSFNQFDRGMRSPLSMATPDIIAQLARLGANVNYVMQKGDPTELMSAISFGYGDEAIALLKCGANPNAQDCYGKTALMYAIFEKNVEVMQFLITLPYVNLGICDNEGKTAFAHVLEATCDTMVCMITAETSITASGEATVEASTFEFEEPDKELVEAYVAALAYRKVHYEPLWWLAWQWLIHLSSPLEKTKGLVFLLRNLL
jgi:ankyrin repeat protein